jgi:hypothetical protein
MSTMRDYADKSWLRTRDVRTTDESTIEKVAAVIGLVFMLVLVFGIMVVHVIIR